MNFKKHIAIFFAIYYLAIGSGFAINLHFCGGELESVSTALSEIVCGKVVETSCCSVKKEVVSDCCDDETVDFNEAADDETILPYSEVFHACLELLPNVFSIGFSEVSARKQAALPFYTFQSNAPPLYKLYCTFIYYA